MSRLALHLLPTSLKYSSRALRMTKTLVDTGLVDRVEVIGIAFDGERREQDVDPRRRFIAVPVPWADQQGGTGRKMLFFLWWSLLVAWRYLPRRPVSVHPHTVSTLPLALLFRLVGTRIVYEPHEFETETTYKQRGPRRWLAKAIERLAMPFVHGVVVATDPILDWYRATYRPKASACLRNIAALDEQPEPDRRLLRDRLGIPDDHLVFITSGSLGRGRAIEIILDAFASAPPDRHIVFLGYGTALPAIHQRAQACANIHHLPPVPPHDVLRHVVAADAGLAIIERTSPNHYLSFPVRFAESLAAGRPVLVTDLPVMRTIVAEYRCGWNVGLPPTAEGLRAIIANLTPAEIEQAARGADNWRRSNNWEREAAGLAAFYRAAFGQA